MVENTEEQPLPPQRTQLVHIRPEDEISAMAWTQRLKTRVRNSVMRKPATTEVPGLDEEANGEARTNAQYRLEATNVRPAAQRSWLVRIFTCNGCFRNIQNQSSSLVVGVNPNQKLAMYLHWMFRVNFLFLFVVMCVTFFALVIFFAGFITLAGRLDKECVRIGGEEFAYAGAAFADAFALSWTTFSTVGYGSTYPALGFQNTSPTNCFFINFICSFESLIGVLYSGFCGAILFGKVLRIQSHAQVEFSDPLLVRYGSGLTGEGDMNAVYSDDEGSSGIPCPVLEFRIVNCLFNEPGGEIMDASLNVVANINANDADPSVRDALDGSNRLFTGGGYPASSSPINSTFSGDSLSEDGSLQETTHSGLSAGSATLRSLTRFIGAASRRDHQMVSEDPSMRFVSKRIFSKMMIEAPDHPFFKRVWLARHVLDEHSPILKPRVRRQIRRHGGSWPEKLNNYQDIRDSLQFNQILVSLNGVSNISASDVYAQKIYDFVDVNIGYQFVNILYRDEGTLGVDIDLINDVREQNNGGGEPLMDDEGESI